MKKKVVVITGASSGLGKELAKVYFKKVHFLVLSGRNKKELAEFKSKNVDVITGDLTNSSTLKEITKVVTNKYGRVDILINNAGIVFIQPFEKNTDEQLNQIFEINVNAHIKLTQKLFPIMKNQKLGHIINIISSAGMEPKLNHTLYCATKYALRGFTDSLRLEAKKFNIKVTGIYPGAMKTHIFDNLSQKIDQSTFMETEAVAKAIYNISEVEGVSPDSLVITRMDSSQRSLYETGF